MVYPVFVIFFFCPKVVLLQTRPVPNVPSQVRSPIADAVRTLEELTKRKEKLLVDMAPMGAEDASVPLHLEDTEETWLGKSLAEKNRGFPGDKCWPSFLLQK